MVADLVAQGIIFQIRGIGDVILFLLCQIVEHILSADAEQRSQDVAVLRSDGSESVHARTSEKKFFDDLRQEHEQDATTH